MRRDWVLYESFIETNGHCPTTNKYTAEIGYRFVESCTIEDIQKMKCLAFYEQLDFIVNCISNEVHVLVGNI